MCRPVVLQSVIWTRKSTKMRWGYVKLARPLLSIYKRCYHRRLTGMRKLSKLKHSGQATRETQSAVSLHEPLQKACTKRHMMNATTMCSTRHARSLSPLSTSTQASSKSVFARHARSEPEKRHVETYKIFSLAPSASTKMTKNSRKRRLSSSSSGNLQNSATPSITWCTKITPSGQPPACSRDWVMARSKGRLSVSASVPNYKA